MEWVYFAIFLTSCFVAGATGGMFPPGQWYDELNKPSWTPPNVVFPLVWTTLYIFMAAAGALAAISPDNSLALALWSLQIVTNMLWTPVFFGLRKLKAGLFVLVCLWISVAAAMIALWQVDWRAGLLFFPYLIWVTIAGALNLAVVRLNPEYTS
ncbi:tryptophan-rich sensory protein TspO [Sedimentitalea todarodis]|uniref:TspO/MBR family protein n=1 Tax=Sedimentitalea todarodis TaxID=1631240 RepID=A0ABU3VKF1_9RHOB|nr:TspO/MBR family protein [Sedimentitalea todarodis]MDU9006667.1 TspO/MBR family protein [Sedimentitalea todarodis]